MKHLLRTATQIIVGITAMALVFNSCKEDNREPSDMNDTERALVGEWHCTGIKTYMISAKGDTLSINNYDDNTVITLRDDHTSIIYSSNEDDNNSPILSSSGNGNWHADENSLSIITDIQNLYRDSTTTTDKDVAILFRIQEITNIKLIILKETEEIGVEGVKYTQQEGYIFIKK